MIDHIRRNSRRLRRNGGAYIDRAIGGAALIAVHELGALTGHWSALGEHLAVARRARNLGELLRDQVDLLPESRARLRHDHAVRRQLWDGLVGDLSRFEAEAA